MKCKITAFIIIIFLAKSNDLFSQGNVFDAAEQTLELTLKESRENHYTLQAGNNIPSTVLKVSFWFYKNFFSAQDFGSCSFHPSCSQYAVNAMEQKGMVKGYMLTFDRLSRCHSMSPRKYKLHQETGLLYDPVN